MRRNGSRYTTECDHDRARPRLELVRPIPSWLPPALCKSIDRCDRIYTHPHEFPEFSFKWLSRERRSQRREALVLIAKAQLLRMDLASRRIGKPIPGTPYLEGLPIEQLAAWTGLTHSRAARAVQDITRATYQTGKLDKRGRLCAPQSREVKEDPATGQRGYRSRPAVRKFASIFFRRLDVTWEMDAASKRASAKRTEEATKNLNAQAEVARQERARLYALREARILEHRSAAGSRAANAAREEDAAARRRTAIAVDVWREFPEWTAEARRAEMERRIAIEAQSATGPPE